MSTIKNFSTEQKSFLKQAVEYAEQMTKSDEETIEASRKKLDAFDKKHFLSTEGGKVKIYTKTTDEDGNLKVDSLILKDFMTVYGREKIKVHSMNKKRILVDVPLVEYWLKSEDRQNYEGIIFNPVNTDKRFHNLWEGFKVRGKEGDFPHIEYHLKHILCDGNSVYYEYIMKWFAHLIQFPSIKPGVALVIKGKKGAGKSTFFELIFRKILGHTYAKFDHAGKVTGKFNAHHFGKLLMVLEEAVWAGDKPTEGRLKSMITDAKTTIEEKGKDLVEKKSFARFVFITNEKFSFPATNDERRFFAVKASSKHDNDITCFSKFNEAVDSEIEHFMYYLENLKIEFSDVFTPPKSEALFEDVYANMDIFDKWLYTFIDDAAFGEGCGRAFDKCIPTSYLYEHFQNYVKKTRNAGLYIKASKVVTVTKLTQELKNTYGFGYKKYNGQNCIYLQSIRVAKQIFEANYTCKVVWSEPEDIFNNFYTYRKEEEPFFDIPELTEEEKMFYECQKIGQVI